MTSLKKTIWYGVGVAATAPIWAPIAFVTYVSYKTLRFAFRHPVPVTLAIGLGGATTYVGCHSQDRAISVVREVLNTTQRHRSQELEEKLAAALTEQERLRVAKPVQPTRSETPFAFYFVKEKETLTQVAARITLNPHEYTQIAAESGIPDPNRVTTGQLLRIRKEHCQGDMTDVFSQIPPLHSAILSGSERISDRFGDRTTQILALNRKLGLEYQDTFNPTGSRIVYYSQ
jgi:hypothetical protein